MTPGRWSLIQNERALSIDRTKLYAKLTYSKYILGNVMSQLHCYVPDALAKKFRDKAEQSHLSVSKYLAMLVKREVDNQWPDGYFDLFGGWQGNALERSDQGSNEQREELN